jgi:hypothetical protein
VQVFDQKKFKKKDQGFLGVINIRVGDVMPDLSPESDGTSPCFEDGHGYFWPQKHTTDMRAMHRPNADEGPQKIDGQPRGPWKAHHQSLM